MMAKRLILPQIYSNRKASKVDLEHKGIDKNCIMRKCIQDTKVYLVAVNHVKIHTRKRNRIHIGKILAANIIVSKN